LYPIEIIINDDTFQKQVLIVLIKSVGLVFKGLSKGLAIVLDAHNDLSATSSVDVDNQGFIGTVTSGSSFPLTFRDGFQIMPGHTNMVINGDTILSKS
jgi:hypothetical protein